MLQLNDPRTVGREAVRQSVPAELWEGNEIFSHTLLKKINEHPILSHPIIDHLDSGHFDLAAQRLFHLEFRHAFAQIFTDGLIRAMCTSAELEPRLGAMGKVGARFLLQLNVLDELGFQPHADGAEEYTGNPYLSHYVQFDATLRQLGLTTADMNSYQASAAASACRATFEDQYNDHVLLTSVLAISETIFTSFCGPWANSVGRGTPINVEEGYHSIHVEHDGQFVDDDHSEDAWYVFRQAVTPDRYEEILLKTQQWLDTWNGFLDHLVMAVGALNESSVAA